LLTPLPALNFLYCAVSLPIFWAAIAVNSWLAIFLKKDRLFKTHGQLMEAITHIIAWVWPAVNCIILIAVKKAGGVSTITFCWIRGSNTTDFNWDYPLFFGPYARQEITSASPPRRCFHLTPAGSVSFCSSALSAF
jgi:hypothetical protein